MRDRVGPLTPEAPSESVGGEGAALRDALVRLKEPGCPACRSWDEAEDRFFAWFIIENYNEPDMVERLSASVGMCPAHTRRFLKVAPVWSAPNFVYGHVVRSVRARLDQRLRPETCPVCARCDSTAIDSIDPLVRNLGNRDVGEAYERSGGLCVEHLLLALRRVEPATAVFMARVGARAMGSGGLGLVSGAASADRDAETRFALRSLLPTETGDADDEGTTLGLLWERLRIPACPVCLAVGQAARRYFAWLSEQAPRNGRPPGPAPPLCPTHLSDLRRIDPRAAAWIAKRLASEWSGALEGFSDRLERVRTGSFPARVKSFCTARRHAEPEGADADPELTPSGTSARGRTSSVGSKRARLIHEKVLSLLENARVPCSACRALAVTEARQISLLVAALEDRPTARRYERSHGLCLRHVLSVVQRDSAPIVEEVIAARLALVGWELEEAARKRDWPFRHEFAGPEGTAWLRAPALLDGRVFEGGPAVALIAGAAERRRSQRVGG